MTASRKRRGLVSVLAVALAAVSLPPVLRIRFETDVLRLMPREAGAIDAFETYLERFGSLDALYVYVEAPEGGFVADYRDYVDTLAEVLRALPEVTRVDTGLLDSSRDWTYLTDRQLLLLDDRGFEEALARVAPARVSAEVARTRELLALPSPVVKAMAQRDPLGWFELSNARLRGASGVLRLDPGRTNGYVTADGRAQLLVVYPTQPPFDTTYARNLLARITDADARVRSRSRHRGQTRGLEAPRMDVAGGHRTSIETETLMRGEAVSNTIWSMVGVLALLYLAFRNMWLVLFGTLPILLGTLVTLALHQVAGVQLSAAATGAAAMLFGLGDDGVVLVFVATAIGSRGAPPTEPPRGLGGPASASCSAYSRRRRRFSASCSSTFPSLQQLGRGRSGHAADRFLTLTVMVAGLLGREWAALPRDL